MTFFFTLVFMFLVFWRPQEWLMPWLYGWPMLDAVVGLSLLALLMEIDQGRINFPKRNAPVYLLIGLWAAAVMSHVVHTYFAGMTFTMKEVFKICFFTFLVYCILDSNRKLRRVALVFVASACVMGAHAILQEKRGYGFAGIPPLHIPAIGMRAPHTRTVFFGIFSDPNDMAQMLVATVPLVFALPKRHSPFSLLLCTLLAAFLVRAYFTTHSRGGLVGLIAVGAILLMLRTPSRWIPYLAGAGLVVALGICATFGASLLDASARERVVFWGYGNMAFKQNLIFGIGYEMYWLISYGRPAHNAFVTCYTELGVVGYWMWFSLLLLGVVGTWRVRLAMEDQTGEEQAWLYGFSGLALASLGGFAASAYFLSRTFVFPLFFLLAVVNSIPRAADAYLPENHEPVIQPRRDLFGYGTLATLGSIAYIYLSILFLNRGYGG